MKKIGIIFIITIVAFIVRVKDYPKFPVFGETQDELAWTWLGTSLIGGQKPTTWSGTNLTGYDSVKNINLAGQSFSIVTPYFDNPYFFSLIPGAAAYLKGYKDITLPSLTVIRFPMVLLGTANVLLLFFVAQNLLGFKKAILASLLYATIPSFVFTSRLVVAENFLITLMLLSFLLIKKIDNDKPSHWALLLGIVSGIAMLTKVAGLVIVIANCLILALKKSYKNAGIVGLAALALGSLYPLYGLIENPELFRSVIAKQASFPIGLSGLLSLFIYPQLVQKTIIDGWMYLGLIALFWQIIFHKPSQPVRQVVIYALLWLGFLLTATPEVISHGWYKYPLFPLMAVSLSALIFEAKKYRFFPLILTLLVLLPIGRLALISQHMVLSKVMTRIVAVLPFGLLVLPQQFFEKGRSSKIMIGLLFVLLFLNCLVIFSFNEISYWEDSLYFYPIRQNL